MKRKGEQNKAEQVPKKKKAQEEEEPSESEESSSEEEVQTKGKKATPKAAAKKQETKPAKKTEEPEKKKPVKQEQKKPAKKEESSEEEEEESDEESEEEQPKPVKGKAKAAPKAVAKKAKKEESEDEDSDEEEEEEEKPKTVTKSDNKAGKNAKPAAKDDDSDEDEEEEDEEEEEEKPKTKPAVSEDTGGLVVKSAANGGMKIKGAPPPARATSPESNTIFIKNLPWSVTDDNMHELFSDCGQIKDIRWVTDRDSGKFKGYGFLEFDSVESAKKAFEKNGTDLGGRPIVLDFSTPKTGGGGGGSFKPKPKTPGSRTVFVGKCPDSIEDEDLKKLFESCGSISSIRWVTDRNTGKFKGCGFVVFNDTASTDKAVALNGKTVKGVQVRIDFADD